MSAVQALENFEFVATPTEVWRVVSDLRVIGGCIPGCEGVTLLPNGEAEVHVKIKVGYIGKTFRMRVRTTEAAPLRALTFLGHGEDGELTGELRLEPTKGKTRVACRLSLRPTSTLGRTATALMGKAFMRHQAQQFAKCLAQVIRATGTG
jgi:carbon monoxide dehydrogenase subunit G